jgi:hypothetical protein
MRALIAFSVLLSTVVVPDSALSNPGRRRIARSAPPLSMVLTDIVLSNGSFEDPLPPGATRPPYWFAGAKANPLASGSWSIDRSTSTHGSQSLKLEPAGEFFVSQILHVPGKGLAGRTITVRASVKHEGLSAPPVVLLYAMNPEITANDPIFGVPGFSASTAVVANATPGVWHEVTGSIVSPTETTAVAVILAATSAGGRAWFDDVEVDAPRWSPQPGAPPVPQVPISRRTFDMGFTSTAPMDSSERGFENLIHLSKTTGNLINFFVPIRWCRLAANPIPCESDTAHRQILEEIEQAGSAGLKIALTFNFTHASAATVGDLNPLPGGSSPGTLLDANVRAALMAELLWLYERILPSYVITGIEMDILQIKHPDWWAPWVALHGAIYDAIKAQNAATHVTAYFRQEWAVTETGSLNAASAATWRMLLPKLDSIAFSSYPVLRYPAGYFSRARDIAPNLPILAAEFGVAGGEGATWTESQQVELLQRMIEELAAANPVALVYYQPFDMNYLGQPQFFKDTWSRIGLGRMDGSPKSSFVLWRELSRLGP